MNRDSSHEKIVPYNPTWIELYKKEAEKIKEVFGDKVLGIEHIGSTSVLGLPSKPIIDIVVLVSNHKDAEEFIPQLKEIGYSFDTTSHTDMSTERHLLRKGDPTQFHLSIAYTDRGGFWKRQLAFRDYLREHPKERDTYAELKRKLIKEDPTGKNKYISGKTDFVNQILDKAGYKGKE